MAVLVVDSSTIISCAMNCLMWVFNELKSRGFRFVVPKGVKDEVIDSGLRSKKFKYEAIRVMRYFSSGIFEEHDMDVRSEASEMLSYANSSFYIKHNPLRILQQADAEVAVLARKINADAIVTDEKTLRLLVEAPDFVKKILERKFHERVTVNERALHSFNRVFEGISVVRSVDLIALAYDIGIFDEMVAKCQLPNKKRCGRDVLEGVLYALRFSGCAVSFKEIEEYVNLLS